MHRKCCQLIYEYKYVNKQIFYSQVSNQEAHIQVQQK